MDKLTIGKEAATAEGLVPTTVNWSTNAHGEFNEHSEEEKSYRALLKALTAHYAKKTTAQMAATPAEKNTQFSVQGPHFFLGRCDRTTAGKQSTYHATGRAKVWIHNMAADRAAEEMVSFDITFRDSRDQYAHSDVEMVSGTIDALPRGTPLIP